MSWLEDELGIDPSDVIEFGGAVIDLWDNWERKEVSDAAAKFTRQRQILDISAFVREQFRLKDINTARKEWLNVSQRNVLEGTRDYAWAEAAYWNNRATSELEMGREQAADDALLRRRQFDSQSAALAVRGAEIAARRLSVPHERAENELRMAQSMARRETLARERTLLDAEAAERGEILAARTQAQQAGLAAVQARQAQVRGVGEMRTTARIEEAQMATGAVAAGSAARGMAGSFTGTATAQIGREAARDIAEIGLGVRSELAGLGERQAGLMLEGQRIESEGRLGAARDVVRRAELDAEGMGLSAEQAGLRARGAELGGREGILSAQEAQLGVEALAIASGREVSGRQLGRDLLQADLAAGQLGLRGAGATLDATRAIADLGDLELDISQLGSEITSGDTAIAIANWTLSRVPELPDTDAFFLRSALGTLLGSGQGRWGD